MSTDIRALSPIDSETLRMVLDSALCVAASQLLPPDAGDDLDSDWLTEFSKLPAEDKQLCITEALASVVGGMKVWANDLSPTPAVSCTTVSL